MVSKFDVALSQEKFDLVLVGTGFAASFFLLEYLRRSGSRVKVLVLEKGVRHSYSWKLENRTNSDVNFQNEFVNLTPQKGWVQNIAFGGGGCWTGNCPRLHPSDFRTKTLHGVGVDWPIEYNELEPYFSEVEEIMDIAGEGSVNFPRSRPYPGVAHRLNAFDNLLKKKYPEYFMAMPSARAGRNSTSRPSCCNSGVCSVCPVGAKFQVDLHLFSVFDDPRVQLLLQADVQRVNTEGGIATGVTYLYQGREISVRGSLVVLAAHAIATPAILLRSGFKDAALGRYLNEQISVNVRVDLSGVENFDGGQRVSGFGFMFGNERNRAEVPACNVESYNVPWLRADFGRWRHVAHLMLVMEDIPSEKNYVALAPDGRPATYYAELSDYARRGVASANSRVERLLEGLPVEDYHIEVLRDGEIPGSAHIQGTTRMGNDPASSVVDKNLIHHKVRNLICLGSGVFPTCPAANPTLPLSALSLRAARLLFS